MEPLDLTKGPPRACREELGGIAFLPRVIDKVRGTLPGGKPGAYINEDDSVTTMSGLFYRRMGVTHAEFEAAVARAADEAEVLAWLRPRIDEEKIAKWHRQLFGARLSHVRPEDWALVTSFYPAAATAPKDTLMIDVIDRDDAATFG